MSEAQVSPQPPQPDAIIPPTPPQEPSAPAELQQPEPAPDQALPLEPETPAVQTEPTPQVEAEKEVKSDASFQLLKPVELVDFTPREKDVALVGMAVVINKSNGKSEKPAGDESTQKAQNELSGFKDKKSYVYEETDEKGNFKEHHTYPPDSNLVLEVKDGKYVIVPEAKKSDGTYVTVTAISGRDGVDFLCHVNGQDPNDPKTTVRIPINTVLTQQLILTYQADQAYRSQTGMDTNKKAREQFFSDEEAAIIGAYVDRLSGDRAQAGEKMKNITDERLHEIASANGLLSAASMRKFIEINRPHQEENSQKITDKPENERDKIATGGKLYNAQTNEILKDFADRIVADPVAAGNFIQSYGIESIEASIDAAKKELTQAETRLVWKQIGGNATVTKDPMPGFRGNENDLIAIIEKDKTLLKTFREIQAVIKKSNLFNEFFISIQKGETSVKRMQEVNKGLESNNFVEALNAMADENWLDDTRKQLVNKLKQYSEMGGMIGGLFLFLLLKKASEGKQNQSPY